MMLAIAADPVAARDVHDLVEGLRRDRRRTVILTTHNLVEAQRLCDRVMIVLLLSQVSGVLYLDLPAVAVVGVIVWAAATGTLVVGYRSFHRERLLVQL